MIKSTAEKRKEKLIRVTAWIPSKKLKALMKEEGEKYSQSEILRMLVDNELERIRSWKTMDGLYGIAKEEDFNDRLL